MKKFIHTLLLLLIALPILAQDDHRPTRTPEEEAMKQTEMLQRELDLTPAQHDSIYRIHLRYAKLRRVSNTRQEMLIRINTMTQELLNVLNKTQRELFLGKQIDREPRRPQCSVSRIMKDSI